MAVTKPLTIYRPLLTLLTEGLLSEPTAANPSCLLHTAGRRESLQARVGYGKVAPARAGLGALWYLIGAI